MKQAFESNFKRTSLFFSFFMAFTFTASNGSAVECSKWSEVENNFLTACRQADSKLQDKYACEAHAELCSSENVPKTCDIKKRKMAECALSPTEIDSILGSQKEEYESLREKVTSREGEIEKEKKDSAEQQSNMMDQLLGQMDKKAEADKEFYEAQQDYLQTLNEKNDEFLQTNRDIQNQMIETSDQYQQQQADMRDSNIERLDKTNRDMIGLQDQKNNLFSRRLQAGKAVRDEIARAEETCRASVRQYETQIGNQIAASANSSVAIERNLTNARTLNGIGGFNSKIRKIRDDMYAQCIEDSQRAIELARQQQSEVEQMIELEQQKITAMEQTIRQNQENQNVANQQRLAEAQQTVVQKQDVAQRQIADAQGSRDAAVSNAGVVLQNAQRTRDEAKANADQGMQLAMVESLKGNNLMNGGGGGDPDKNMDKLKSDADAAEGCLTSLERSRNNSKNKGAYRRLYARYKTHMEYYLQCEGTSGSSSASNSTDSSSSRSPSSGQARANQ